MTRPTRTCRYVAETDSVAGHIGFELRCAERIFISLNMRQFSDSQEPQQTARSSGRIIFSRRLECWLPARGLSVSSHPVRIFSRGADRIRTAARFFDFSMFPHWAHHQRRAATTRGTVARGGIGREAPGGMVA